MRGLREREKVTVFLRAGGSKADAYGDPVPLWGEPVAIRVVCQPAGGALDAQLYGTRVKSMYTLFYAGLEAIKPGDGLCVHVVADARPDYRVVAVQEWELRKIDAEFIPPELRRG